MIGTGIERHARPRQWSYTLQVDTVAILCRQCWLQGLVILLQQQRLKAHQNHSKCGTQAM